MEGQSKISYPTKRLFIIFLTLLTLFFTNINATNSTPLPIPPVTANFKNLTYKAVPIFANTLTTFNNLKTAHSAASKAIEPIAAAETSAMVLIAKEEEVPHAKNEVVNAALLSNFVSSTAVISNVSKAERRKDVAYFAESHTDWGFKYRYGGTSIEKGIDCSGFTRYVLGYFDIKAARTAEEQYENGTKIPLELAKAGDLVFFGYKRSISHVAVVVSNDKNGLFVVHSTTSRGIIKENVLESDYWKSKLKNTAVNIIGD